MLSGTDGDALAVQLCVQGAWLVNHQLMNSQFEGTCRLLACFRFFSGLFPSVFRPVSCIQADADLRVMPSLSEPVRAEPTDRAEARHRAMSEQRLAVSGGNTRAAARRPGGRAGLERGLDGVGNELRGLRVDGDVAAEQYAADDLPGVPGRVLRVDGHVSPPWGQTK